jgi:hypothetical protein
MHRPRRARGSAFLSGASPRTKRASISDWFARFVAIDNPTSSALTRQTLGWHPQGPDLLTHMRESGYFE